MGIVVPRASWRGIFSRKTGIGTRKEKRGQETNEEGQSKLPNSTKDRRTRTEKGDISKELRKGTFLKSFDKDIPSYTVLMVVELVDAL